MLEMSRQQQHVGVTIVIFEIGARFDRNFFQRRKNPLHLASAVRPFTLAPQCCK